ncbi:MAG: DUF554 domain-containing protein [Parasporobacterium sp.]|nr:DUF554 domain-containing protein [Parasporobacterium sp.]
MYGLGTIINTAAIIVGGVIGLLFGKLIPKRVQESLVVCNGISVIIIGISGAISKMLTINEGGFDTQKSMLLTLALVLGTILGSALNLERLLERFGDWLKSKSKSDSDNQFTEAFIISSCTVCIGAMAVIGALNDVLTGDISVLLLKSILDLITICALTCAMGKGCVFSAISVLLFQGVISVIAWFIKPIMTDLALADLSFVGSVLIFVVGLNLVRDKKISVVNMLPSILFAVGFSFIPALN